MTPNNRQNRPDAGWRFDNSYVRLPEAFYARLNPVPVRRPKLVVFNAALAQFLGLDPEALNGDEGAAVFSGNRIPEGAEPLAQAYAGHQFGHFTMLGDGRAILLGEQLTPKDERFDIQYKGSGRTPFSRQGDGRAAMGPMLREYIISEALHGLGIPTTRSLARLQRQPDPWEASRRLMNTHNPAVIPRNHRVEEALAAAAERVDYTVMEKLLGVLSRPYQDPPEQGGYHLPAPQSAQPYQTFCGT